MHTELHLSNGPHYPGLGQSAEGFMTVEQSFTIAK